VLHAEKRNSGSKNEKKANRTNSTLGFYRHANLTRKNQKSLNFRQPTFAIAGMEFIN